LQSSHNQSWDAGNFSYASALCHLLHSGENIVATCYDTEQVLHQVSIFGICDE
jgi:hypothetical protein